MERCVVVFGLKSRWTAIMLLALCTLPLVILTLSPRANAASLTVPSDVNVDQVVQIRDGGLLIINDTVRLLAQAGQTVEISNYTFGFPYGYQLNLDYAFAYETSNPSSKLKLDLDVSMGRTGFYGVNVDFSPRTITITNDKPYEFTVVFVFSDRIVLTTDGYNATFPAYPSLTQKASVENLTITFPTGLNYTDSSFEKEGANFTRTSTNSTQYFNYVKNDLTEFSDDPGWFSITSGTRSLKILEVKEIQREVELSGTEQMSVSDSYTLVSKAGDLSSIDLILPQGASGVSAYDEFGAIPSANVKTQQGSEHTNVTVTFSIPYSQGNDSVFLVNYQVPWKDFVSTNGGTDFSVSFPFSEDFEWTIRKLTVIANLPEGSSLADPELAQNLDSVQSNAFGSELTFVYRNATPFHNIQIDFVYGRSVFWEAFRPTLWMSAIVIVAAAIIGVWRYSKPTVAPLPTAITRIRAEDLKSYVDLYEEKRSLQREAESLETQARKGKIPRPRYKARKMTIESRLTSLSRSLKALDEKIRTAGPRYNDLMRQIEVAETELESVEADISRTEVRYRRGEISPAAYNKHLEDAYRRRDRATTTIDGVLLRLKEEIT